MFPFTAQPQATEFATTKQKSILPHDAVFPGGWKPRSPHPKKVVPQTLQLKHRFDNCYFCSSARYEASFVRLLQALGREEWMQNWKDRSSASWLENGILYYLQQNSASRHWAGKGERTMGRDRSWRFIQETDSIFGFLLLVWLHAYSWLSTWGPVTQSMFSIFLWLSETDLGALPDLG